MKAKKAPPWPMLCGLLILLALVTIVVWVGSPEPKGADYPQQLLQAHEGILYFIDAEIMAKPLCPDPSLYWTHDLLDDQTGCVLVGNGVWYASGLITAPGAPASASTRWQVLFLPEEHQPLFVKVGDRATGDAQAALRRAKGATGEK